MSRFRADGQWVRDPVRLHVTLHDLCVVVQVLRSGQLMMPRVRVLGFTSTSERSGRGLAC